MHTRRSVMCTAVGGSQWFGHIQDRVSLSVLPYFHGTGKVLWRALQAQQDARDKHGEML